MNQLKDIAKSAYAAFAQGDIPTVLGLLDDQVQWTEAEGGPYGGIFIGPTAVLENVFARIGADWEEFTAVPSEFIGEGDTVISLGEYCGTYKATGRSFRAPFAHVWKFSNGKATSFHQYTDTAVHLAPMQQS